MSAPLRLDGARVLVTGGAGFIGSNFVHRLLAQHPTAHVVVLDALTYAGRRENLDGIPADRLTFVHGDIRDPEAVARAMAGCAFVLNFAAESHVDRSIETPGEFIQTDVYGVFVLAEEARRVGVQRFIQVSTDEVYGEVLEGHSTEEWPLNPRSPYAASKAGGDRLAYAYWCTYGLPVVVTRCSNNYGPRQFPEKVIPLFVTNLMDGLNVPLYGDGLNVRDWLHVDDHCRGILAVLDRGRAGEVYNIGGGTELTNRELTTRLLALCGADESRVTPVADRLGHDRRYCVDWGKIHRELGYSPQVDFAEGLAATVAWYQENESWWRPLKAAQ